MLSSRAQQRLEHFPSGTSQLPPTGLYDESSNPEGAIKLATAENSLMTTELIERYQSTFHLSPAHLEYRHALVLPTSTVPHLDDLLVTYANDSLRPISSKVVTRENSVTGPGVGALLASLVWTLVGEGEGVLLTTPFYHDYARDIQYPAQAEVVLVHTPPELDSLSPEVLPLIRQKLDESLADPSSVQIKAMILCNPHNPLGRCYPEETIRGYAEIAEEYDLHLIVDEVFANSTYTTSLYPSLQHFISILSLDLPQTISSSRIHVLHSPCKDLGCSAFKAGILINNNPEVRMLVGKSMNATPISGLTDAVLSGLLSDRDETRKVLDESSRRLGVACELLQSWCKFHDIPFEPTNAGVYCLVDFSPVFQKWMNPPRSDRSIHGLANAASRALLENGVILSPSHNDQDPKMNRYRLIFSRREEVMKIAFGRLEKTFGLTSSPYSHSPCERKGVPSQAQ